MKQEQVLGASTTLLWGATDSQHARRAVFCSRYERMRLPHPLTRVHPFDADLKNFHFPRHISGSKHEYVMESMETKGKMAAGKSDGFTCRLDPNRVRTDAEVATFAEVFRIPVDEARRILTAAGRKCRGAAESSFSGRSGDAELKSISEMKDFLFLRSSDSSNTEGRMARSADRATKQGTER